MSTNKQKLTKSFIDNLPLSPDKQIIYRDSELTGFGLRVKGIKSFVAEKKLPSGTPCRVTIGAYGLWTVAQAREKAREILLLIAQGVNPNAEKSSKIKAAKNLHDNNNSIPTLLEAYEFYKSRKNLSPNSLKSYNACINDYFKDWNKFKLDQINKKMIIDRHLLLSERSPAQANLAAKFLHALYRHSIEKMIDDMGERLLNIINPVSIIKEQKALNKIKRRRTYIRSDQHHDWAMAVVTSNFIGQQNSDKHAYTNQDYLLLLSLTGFRREEAETVEWSKIDLKYGTITITDTKNGDDLMLPMGNTLWYILKQRKLKSDNSIYVFPDRTGKSHITDRRNAREKITEMSGIEFTFHDLRRTFSSIANSLAIGSYTIKKLINHTIEDDLNDVTDGYVQVSFDDLRKAMNMIEDVVLPEQAKQLIKNRIYFEKGSRRNFDEDWEKYINSVLISD